MPTDFWTLIGSCSVETSDDVKSALDQVSARLDALEPPDLVHFAAQLEEHLHRIDRRELAEVPVVFRGEQFPQTADHFLYARCACILAGEEAYRNSARSPVQFARFVKPAVQGAENLLYLARSSYEKKAGRKMDGCVAVMHLRDWQDGGPSVLASGGQERTFDDDGGFGR